MDNKNTIHQQTIDLLTRIISNIKTNQYTLDQIQSIFDCNEEYITGEKHIDSKMVQYLISGWYMTEMLPKDNSQNQPSSMPTI
jgi:hypothetical protein